MCALLGMPSDDGCCPASGLGRLRGDAAEGRGMIGSPRPPAPRAPPWSPALCGRAVGGRAQLVRDKTVAGGLTSQFEGKKLGKTARECRLR